MLFFGAMYAAKLYRDYQMRVIACVIRPSELDDLIMALRAENLMAGLTVMDVRGFGRQGGHASGSNGDKEKPQLIPKLKVEILVKATDLKRTLEVISTTLRTGEFGDGKIIVYKAVAAMRIRTGEKGIWSI